jgi:hypothetical protein
MIRYPVDRRVCRCSYIPFLYPQVQKAWPRGSPSDLSLKMLLALTAAFCSG